MIEFNIRRLIHIIIAILLSILVVKLFIWALPIIIIVILANYIYKFIKRINVKIEKEDEVENIKRRNTRKNKKPKSKKIIIIDEENNE